MCSKEADQGARKENLRSRCLSHLQTRPCQLEARTQPICVCRHPLPSALNVVSAQISLVSMKNCAYHQQRAGETGTLLF